MSALDFVIDLISHAFLFISDTKIFGKSIFFWCAGFAVVNVLIDNFIGGDDDAD